MKEKIAKIVSLIGSLASLFFSIKWMCHSHFDYEPIITSIGLFVAIIGQGFYWKNKNNVYHVLEKSNGGGTQVDQVLNFSMYDYEIIINPKQRGDYWRCGVKLSEDFNISLGPLTPQCPLYHLTQTNTSVLNITCYPDGTTQNGFQDSIDPNYKKEEVVLKLSSNFHQLTIIVLKNGNPIQSKQVNKKFIYGKLLAWGDEHHYKIGVRIKRIPKF